MISVIVPVYRAEKTIARCIESVISQVYTDWELILVDDGSPDRSGIICDEYATMDERIRVFHRDNGGVSMARNRGIDEAKGEYLCFIDSDDYVTPYYLSSFYMFDDCDFEIQGMTLTYIESLKNKKLIPEQESICSLYQMFEYPSLWYLLKGPYCKLFRHSILVENCVRFPIEFRYGEDEIFVLDYLRNCTKKVAVISLSNYFYTHESDESLSRSFVEGPVLQQTLIMQFRLFKDVESHIGSFPPPFLAFYRKDRSFDFYQSIYNTWVDHRTTLSQKVCSLLIVDKSLWSFLRENRDLPIGFRYLRMLLLLTIN